MDVKTGKILALASNPTFDPNDATFATLDKYSNPLRNVATGLDYEVGSVIKPITVAVALDAHKKNMQNKDGKKLGVTSDWTGGKAGKDGIQYAEGKTIQNADGKVYDSPQSLSNILRDSINTGIAELVPTVGNTLLKDYFTNKLRLGTPTAINLPGDTAGNFRNFNDPKNIFCDFCFANYGFGQGFEVSPIQLMRAYSPLANNGKLVEPYLVEKITNEQGDVVDDGTKENSVLKRRAPEQVLDSTVAKDVTQYLVNTTEQGYAGDRTTAISIPGFHIAGKTGTSQIGHQAKYTGECPDRNWYGCNTGKGIYEHTYVSYGPAIDPSYMVLIKLSEPRPGIGPKNFAVTTLGEPIKDMMNSVLTYMNAPRDKK
jgi:cell division protein FtsI/penicillin-binding protein 2